MSRVATTELGLAPAVANNGGNFDVFASLRDGSEVEDFSSGIGEGRSADTDEAASSLDLVAVASGEAELNTVTSSKPESKETSAPVNPEQCQKYGTIACIACIFAQDCQDRQAAMTAGNTEVQPGEQLSTLEQLLREDEAPGEIVWAQVVPETDEVGDLGQAEEVLETKSPSVVAAVLDDRNTTEDDSSKEQASDVHDEKDVRIAETTIEVVNNAGVDDHAVKPQATNSNLDEPAEMSEQSILEDKVVLPTPTAVEAEPVAPAVEDVNKASDDLADMAVSDIQASPQIETKEPKSAEIVKPVDSSLPTSPVEVPLRETSSDNTMVDNTGDCDNSYHVASEPEEKSAPPATEQEPPVQTSDTPVNMPTEYIKHETPAKETVAVQASMPAKEQPDQPVAMTPPIQDHVEYGEKAPSVSEESAVDYSPVQPAVVDMPVVHEAVEVVPTENAAIEPEALTPIIPVETVVGEDELWTDPPQDGNREAAVDQTVYEVQISPVEQFDDVVMEENSRGNGEEVWAEEDVVFFVEQPSVAEPEAPLTGAVTPNPLAEATIMTSEEIDEPEIFVVDESKAKIEIESIESLDNLQRASVPEITKDDHGPVEQNMIPVSSAIEPVSNVTLDEVLVQVSEEYILPHKKRDNVITTTSEENDLWLGDDEPEAMAMNVSDAERSVDLSEEQEEPVVINRVAEVAETELNEQDDLMTDDAADGYDYSSEVDVANNFLIVKHHPSLGLWTDDSWLNPEEEAVATIQSGATDTSLASRLVGVLVVAICVARGRQASAIASSR